MSISEIFPHFFNELSIHSLKCAKAQLGSKPFLLLSFNYILVGSLLRGTQEFMVHFIHNRNIILLF